MIEKLETRIKIFLACLLAGIFLLSCGHKIRVPKKPPNILVLLVDTFRADSLIDYGYFRNTNPFLSKFGKKGVRFARAYSHSSHTKISVASIFTGLIPPVHKVRFAAFPHKENKEKILSDVLSSDFYTIAEVLEREGYITAAFVTNPHLRSFLGFSQGFNEYKYYSYDKVNAEKVNTEVINWLKGHPVQPFFIYIHYMDVHSPYNPPDEYRYLYSEKKGLHPIKKDGPWESNISEEQIEYTKAMYDAQINYWDDCFREFIKKMEEEEWLKNTLIIILGDHGEEFYDHGGFGHGFTLYEEELRVPLYVIFEDYIPANQVRTDPVQFVDIFPTICYFAKVDIKKYNLQENNLFSPHPKKGNPEQIIYAETCLGEVPNSVQTERYKLIYNSQSNYFEFYDLIKDPKESNNIYKENNSIIEKLKIELIQILALDKLGPKTQKKELDAETIKKLKSLGYIK